MSFAHGTDSRPDAPPDAPGPVGRATSGSLFEAVVCLAAVTFLCLPALGLATPAAPLAPRADAPAAAQPAEVLTLRECIDLALARNRRRSASQASVAIAEAQYRQALSAHWPRLTLDVTAMRLDHDPDFLFPAQSIPPGAAAGPMAEAIAATQLAKRGVTPASVGVDVYDAMLAEATAAAQSSLPASQVPAQKIKLLDRDTLSTNLALTYPLYTGGKITAVARQGKKGLEAAREDARRTDLQIVRDVKTAYYGSVLARSLRRLGEETLARMTATLEVTEHLYRNGSGRTKKTDYLRTRVIVATIRSLVEELRSNDELAAAALANVTGLPWNTGVEPADRDIPFQPLGQPLDELVARAQELSPEAVKVTLGLQAAEARIDEAKAGHLPVFVLFGKLSRFDNAYDAGIATAANKQSWSLGIRMELPIFDGFRTTSAVAEAEARREKLRDEQVLLKEGLALQVKDAFLQVARAQAQVRSAGEALAAASENRALSTRAYQDDLVDTRDVVEAQLLELFATAQHLRALHDAQVNLANLELAVAVPLYAIR
jgi:outer membrane protein